MILVKVFSEVILQVRVLRLLVTLCTIVQGLKRVWGFRSKRSLHKNHKKKELVILILSGLYLYFLGM